MNKKPIQMKQTNQELDWKENDITEQIEQNNGNWNLLLFSFFVFLVGALIFLFILFQISTTVRTQTLKTIVADGKREYLQLENSLGEMTHSPNIEVKQDLTSKTGLFYHVRGLQEGPAFIRFRDYLGRTEEYLVEVLPPERALYLPKIEKDCQGKSIEEKQNIAKQWADAGDKLLKEKDKTPGAQIEAYKQYSKAFYLLESFKHQNPLQNDLELKKTKILEDLMKQLVRAKIDFCLACKEENRVKLEEVVNGLTHTFTDPDFRHPTRNINFHELVEKFSKKLENISF